MPIPRLTDNLRTAYPRIGELRKGAPKPQRGVGKDLEWFRFVTGDDEARQVFDSVFGSQPNNITVQLPFATVDENFEAWMEHWVAGSLKHRCDGETCVVWQDENGEFRYDPIPCPGECKEVGRLMVIIPELRRLAYVQVITGSQHDIMELTANLRAAEDTARLMGRDLRGIDFVLSRSPREISVPPGIKIRGDDGKMIVTDKRIRLKKWLLHIEPAPTWVAFQIEAARKMAMPMIEGQVDIPAPNGDDEEHDILDVKAEEVPDEPEAPTNNGGDLDTFLAEVLDTIPYYNHEKHIKNTLKQLGYTGYKPSLETEMYLALEKHASEKANAEAA